MIKVVLSTLRTLVAYLILGLIFGGSCAPLLFFMDGKNIPFRVWYLIDVMICTVAHDTDMRSISGWTGQHMANKKRYALQAKVIDYLAVLVGDKPNHCYRMFVWEQRKGFVV